MDAGEPGGMTLATFEDSRTVSGSTTRKTCTYLRLEQQKDCKNSQEFSDEFTFHQLSSHLNEFSSGGLVFQKDLQENTVSTRLEGCQPPRRCRRTVDGGVELYGVVPVRD